MRKFQKMLSALVISATLFTACSKGDSTPKETPLKVSTSAPELKYDESTQLIVNIGNTSDYTWTSSNEFVGTVDVSGKFTAHHIGGVTITAEKSGKSAKQEITVTPTTDFFTEPNIDLGSTKAEIKAKEHRELSAEVTDGLAYKDPSPYVRGAIIYVFDNGKLSGVIVPFVETSTVAGHVATFYAERYNIIGESDGTYFFTEKDKKYAGGIDADTDSFGFAVIYFKYTEQSKLSSSMKDHIIKVRRQLEL